jgi:hypothetical protein
MDLAAVFALSLLGGYYFASYWRLTAFSTKREEGHHLYFRAALFGVVLFLLALLLRFCMISFSPVYARWDAQIADYVLPVLKEESGMAPTEATRRAEWVITAAYSLVLAPLCAWLLNVCRLPSRANALRRTVSGLDKLLLQAQQLESPVAFTLHSGKIYIGMVVDTLDPSQDADVVTILPILSGLRDELGRTKLTTDYEHVYSALQAGRASALGLSSDWLERFRLAIRIESITSAALFSPAVYAEFNPNWREQLSSTSEGEDQDADASARASSKKSKSLIDAVLALVLGK